MYLAFISTYDGKNLKTFKEMKSFKNDQRGKDVSKEREERGGEREELPCS